MSRASNTPADGEGELPPASGPSRWHVFRAAAQGMGLRPSRRLGQSFLMDENVARAIARESGVAAGEFVLEVGPGSGMLTSELLELGVELLAVEIDARLHAFLERTSGSHPRARFFLGDILAKKSELNPHVREALPGTGRWHLVANLPYSSASPTLVCLSRLEAPPATMNVLLQDEVADRILAAPGGKAYGPLGVRLGAVYSARRGRQVPARLFWPRPTVESTVVHLELLADPLRGSALARFDRLVGELFQKRRKSLGRTLSDLAPDRASALALCEALDLDPKLRPEALSVVQLSQLAEGLYGPT